MKKTVLREYARLIALKGANVQKGQEVIIYAGLDQPEFIAMLVDECYKAKAKKVSVEWDYQPLTKIHVRHQSVKTLGTITKWQEEKLKYRTETLPAMIYIISDDPDGLKGINQTKMVKSQRLRYPIIKPYRDAMENKYQWCIAAVPGKAWAKKLFPELRASQAVEKLWQAILDTSRVKDDPIEEWNKHNAELKAHCKKLNELGIEKLHYTSSNGTDFTVGMMAEGRFRGGSDKTVSGVEYNPNMPTEECFISPKKGVADGIVYSTKPLSYQGQIIDNFNIRFENGKAVEWHAEKNEELLGKMITMDEGSAYLGECALVPYNSPVCQSGILFYETLFDENAACHLALGEGFRDTIEGFENLTLEQCMELGMNDSMIHVDFMIGSPDLSIDAICRDGKVVPIFRNGNWA